MKHRFGRVAQVIALTALLLGAVMGGVAEAGTGWGQQYAIADDTLWAVEFVDASNGWAVGDGGVVLATGNGGGSWTLQDSHVTASFFGVSFVDTSHGWAVGSQGTIIATNNGGDTWVEQTSPTTEALDAVVFVDATHGWAFGEGGTVLATTNGGGVWTEQDTPRTIAIKDAAFVDANRGWAVGNSGWIIKTTDGGETWTELLPAPTPNDLVGVAFTDANRGWAVGDSGVVFATFDGGGSWSKQTSATNIDLWDVAFVDASHGWAVGFNGVIVSTSNGGNSWTLDNAADVSKWATLAAVSFTDTGHGWAVGGGLRIYRDPPPTGWMTATPGSGGPGTVISARSDTPCPDDSTYARIELKNGSGVTLASARAANFSGSGAWSGTVTVPTGAISGAAFVTATCFGTSAKDITQEYNHVAFTVTPTLVAITVTPSNPTIPQDSTKQFTATGTYSDGSTQVLTNAVWELSDPSVATITGSGLATGLAVGQSTITATSGSVVGSTNLTVGPGLPTITGFSPASGRPGTRVTITGNHFSGVTSVTFNGTPAIFTVQSDTKITTKVPKGATTGPIAVSSTAGSATSTGSFVVKK